jgi:hypothetical protein
MDPQLTLAQRALGFYDRGDGSLSLASHGIADPCVTIHGSDGRLRSLHLGGISPTLTNST